MVVGEFLVRDGNETQCHGSGVEGDERPDEAAGRFRGGLDDGGDDGAEGGDEGGDCGRGLRVHDF